MAEIEDRLPYPKDLGDLVSIVRDYFTDNPGRVVSFHVEVGKPVIAKRQYFPGDPKAVNETPYSILRNRTLVNIQSPGNTPLATLHNMHKQVMGAGFVPTCLISWSDKVFDWIGGEDYLPDVPRDRRYILGTEVHIDDGLSYGSIILAGSSNPYAGIWGLEYGVRHVT